MTSLHYLHLPLDEQVLTLPGTEPFKVVLLIQQVADNGWRNRICDRLVSGGCLYALAWGVDCEIWHDAMDWASLESADFQEIPDDQHVMTTWHDEEPMSEVFFFAQNCANHPTIELSTTLILDIGGHSRRDDMLNAYRNAQVTSTQLGGKSDC